jgi:succinate-semialdehyde dehydrogenase/glutarate-semialdehyde dehydrogenase
MAIQSINPATGARGPSFEPLTESELEEKLALSRSAFMTWSRLPVLARAGVVAHAGEIFAREAAALGRLATEEMGKLVDAGKQEVEKCAGSCRYYAENAEAFLRPEVVVTDEASGDGPRGAIRGEVRYEPLGAVLAVMPWNFPFWQVVRFAAPAIVAGNVALLKHASNVPRCALAIEDVFRRAGAPAGVFQTLLVTSDEVPQIIADGRVAAVTLTGSETAGRRVAAAAGEQLKKIVLELGGSDPFIVLTDADVDRAVATAVKARIVNTGQSCIAAKRFIVVEGVYDRFAEGFVAAMKALRVGDPMDPATEIGPLATGPILATLADQVARSVAAGARVLVGGHKLERAGNFYAPTVLADVPRGAPAFAEELFGPVATLLRARDVGDALALANATPFGLAASVWTRDRAAAERFARDLDCGTVVVNDMVASDTRFPFGGVKASGHGRELGPWGLREFVNVKTVRSQGLG